MTEHDNQEPTKMDTAVPEPQPTGKIAAKLAKVMAELARVPKNGRNDFHKYDYATAADVFGIVRTALGDAGVAFHSTVDRVEHSEPDNKGNILTTVQGTATYTDESGESFTGSWAGVGQDKGDKGIYKAITGGLKYALMGTLLLDTGDDPEATDGDGNSTRGRSSGTKSAPAKKAATKKAPAKASSSKSNDLPVEEAKPRPEVAKLVAELKEADDHWKPIVRAYAKAHGLSTKSADDIASGYLELLPVGKDGDFWNDITKWHEDNPPFEGDQEKAA